MKRRMTIVLTAGLLLIALAAVAFAVGTQKPTPASASRCETYRQALKDARVEATNTTDGVTVKITGNTPESVKLLQTYWQECGNYHLMGSGCPCDSAGCQSGCGSGCRTSGSRSSFDCGSRCGNQGGCGGHR
jgi:hypothetical protein